MRLFITDHRSAAIAIARALSADPTIESNHIALDNGDRLIWVSHKLLSLASPDSYDERFKQWQLDDLPIIPDKWRLQSRQQDLGQLSSIKKALSSASQVIHCGSADREGQLLVDQLLTYFSYKGDVKRLWLHEMSPAAIHQGLASADDNRAFKSLSMAALARARTDWLIGINLTRACTLVAEQTGFEGVLSFGRVQTPILGLLVQRDRAVESGQRHQLATVRQRKGVHSLTSLQMLMFARDRTSPTRVLQALESLYYDHRVITTPYTDSHQLYNYLKPSESERLAAIRHNLGLQVVERCAVNLYRTPSHQQLEPSGIVPTQVYADVSRFGELEQALYKALCEQYVSVMEGHFDVVLPEIKSLRYTEQSLLADLESVAPYVQNQKVASRLLPTIGFGAPRTRAGQLEGLLRRQYVVGGTQHLVTTQAGRDLIDAFPGGLGGVDFLGRWELGLQELEHGRLSYTDYMTALHEALTGWVAKIVGHELAVRSATAVLDQAHTVKALACPKCGSELLRRKGAKGDFLGCSGYPDCDYTRQLLKQNKRVF